MKDSTPLANKRAFITGGGSGINFGIARRFAEAGADLALCGRTASKLEAAADQLRALDRRVITVAADVRDGPRLAEALAQVESQLGPMDVVVCGAAGNFLCAAGDLSFNGFKTVIDIDLLGSFNTARAAFEQLKKTRGVLIFISAGQSLMPFRDQVHAGAAKAGIDNMMRSLALEWGQFGIRSNSIVPGFIAGTEGAARLAGAAKYDRIVAHTPLGRLGTVDDVANAALFLASDAASFVSGTALIVDGGHYLGGSAVLN